MPQPVSISFPIKGEARGLGYQQQGPYASPYAVNMRSRDTILGRLRGGSRPKLVKAYPTQLGSGNPIRLMAPCRTLNTSASQTYNEAFSASLGGDWAAPGWTGYSGNLPQVSGGYALIGTGFSDGRQAILSGITTVSTSASRSVSMLIGNSKPTSGSQVYEVFLDSRAASTGHSEGVFLVMSCSGAAATYTLQLLINGVEVDIETVTAPTIPAWLKLEISASNVISCFWSSDAVPDISYQATYTPAYTLAGFALDQGASANAAILIDQFRLEYTSSTGANPPTMLMASSNGTLYKSTTVNTMTAVSSSVTLASDRLLVAANRLQSLYIADYGTLSSGTDGETTVGAGTTFDSATVSDWTALSGFAVGDYLRISAGGGSVVVGDYRVDSISAGNFTVIPATMGISGAANVTWKLLRGPKVYDSGANTLTALDTAELVPPGCTVVEQWQDSLVWGYDPDNPHRMYKSERGDPTEYTTGGTNPGDAYSWGASTTAGQIPDRVRSIMAHNDDYLAIGCEKGAFVQRGDPLLNDGQIDTIQNEVGILDKKATCRSPDGYMICMTTDGLYRMPPVADARMEPLSTLILPQELKSIDTSLYTVQLEYDVAFRGVHIMVTPNTAGSSTHWFVDLDNSAFHRTTIASSMEPTAMCAFAQTGETPTVYLGCRDGYIRKFSNSASDDDGEDVTSRVDIGPIMLAPGAYDGMLDAIDVRIGEDSDDVRLYVRVGESVEQAFNADMIELTEEDHPLPAGVGYTYRPRLRGQAAIITLTSTGRWAFEDMVIHRTPLGKTRKL